MKAVLFSLVLGATVLSSTGLHAQTAPVNAPKTPARIRILKEFGKDMTASGGTSRGNSWLWPRRFRRINIAGVRRRE